MHPQDYMAFGIMLASFLIWPICRFNTASTSTLRRVLKLIFQINVLICIPLALFMFIGLRTNMRDAGDTIMLIGFVTICTVGSSLIAIVIAVGAHFVSKLRAHS